MNIHRTIEKITEKKKLKKLTERALLQNKRMQRGLNCANALIVRCKSKGGQTLEQWVLLKELEGLYKKDKNPIMDREDNYHLFMHEFFANMHKMEVSEGTDLLLQQYKNDFGVDLGPINPQDIMYAHLEKFTSLTEEFFDHEDAAYTRIEQLLV